MDNLSKMAVILKLIQKLKERGSNCGETHIQKAVYFLQELVKVPVEAEFILYKYGPFSFDIREQLATMHADDLLKIQPRPHSYGASFYLTEGGGRLCGKKTFWETYEKQIDFVADLVGPKLVPELERLSTALYVTLKGDCGDNEERAQLINQLKPHVSIEQAREALQEMDKIRSSTT
jgi:uncharacterized protein YwgA